MRFVDREVDLAVHSLKDLPTDPVPGLCLSAVSERARLPTLWSRPITHHSTLCPAARAWVPAVRAAGHNCCTREAIWS